MEEIDVAVVIRRLPAAVGPIRLEIVDVPDARILRMIASVHVSVYLDRSNNLFQVAEAPQARNPQEIAKARLHQKIAKDRLLQKSGNVSVYLDRPNNLFQDVELLQAPNLLAARALKLQRMAKDRLLPRSKSVRVHQRSASVLLVRFIGSFKKQRRFFHTFDVWE
jgi:hypothetical protein